MKNSVLKPLLLIGKNEDGEVIAVKIKEGDYSLVADDSHVPTGVVDTPTPANEELERALNTPKRDLDTILGKYKEKR